MSLATCVPETGRSMSALSGSFAQPSSRAASSQSAGVASGSGTIRPSNPCRIALTASAMASGTVSRVAHGAMPRLLVIVYLMFPYWLWLLPSELAGCHIGAVPAQNPLHPIVQTLFIGYVEPFLPRVKPAVRAAQNMQISDYLFPFGCWLAVPIYPRLWPRVVRKSLLSMNPIGPASFPPFLHRPILGNPLS